jgi:threonyl-tRNA synthetase
MKTGKSKMLLSMLLQTRFKTVIEYGEAAFYGPKLDFMVKDALGRQWNNSSGL